MLVVTFIVSSDSKFKLITKPGYEDRSLILFSSLRSDCVISSNDFKNLFDKIPSGPSVVSLVKDCTSLAFCVSKTSSTPAPYPPSQLVH